MFHLIRLAAEAKLTAKMEHRNVLFRLPCNFGKCIISECINKTANPKVEWLLYYLL
jgi:hypothetical protein